MKTSSPSDPVGLVGAVDGLLAGLEGTAQIAIGVVFVLVAFGIITLSTSAGKAAARGAGQTGRLALKAIPQTRAIGALL